MQIKISELPSATKVNNTDALVVVQSGVTKQAPAKLVNALDAGDSITIGTGSIFAAAGASAKVFRFTIPVSQHIAASSATLTGSVRAVTGGTSSGYKVIGTDCTAACTVTSLGVNVEITFSADQSWLGNNKNYSINLSGASLTFA